MITARPTICGTNPAQHQAYEKAAVAARNHCSLADRSAVTLKLTRFRGHRTVCVQGVRDGQDKIALRT